MSNPLDIRQWTERYVAQWNEPDPAARAALIRDLWALTGSRRWLASVLAIRWSMVPAGTGQAAGGGLDILALDSNGQIHTDHQYIGVK